MTILAVAGALMMGDLAEAREYLAAVTGEYTPELQRFVDSIFLLLDPDMAKEMGADAFACSFYLVNMFGQRDPKEVAAEEEERKAREEAERKAREEEERRAKEEAERKAREEAERKAKEEAERKAREEAAQRACEEAERKAKELLERKARQDYIRNEAPYTICLDKVDDDIVARMTARTVFGWGSADFRKNTASLPAAVSTVSGKISAEKTVSQLGEGGLSAHFESEEDFDEKEEICGSDFSSCFVPCTKECLEAIEYAFGQNGGSPDIAKAVELWKVAASKGDPKAMSDYGTCMGIGFGMRKDSNGAVKYLRKAIEQVLPKAQEGDKDSMLFIIKCAIQGILIAPSGKKDSLEMKAYLDQWSESLSEEGNIVAKVLRYVHQPEVYDFLYEGYFDGLMAEIKGSMHFLPVHVDALLFLSYFCGEDMDEERRSQVSELTKETIDGHLYSKDLLSVLMAAGIVEDDDTLKDELLLYYVNLGK